MEKTGRTIFSVYCSKIFFDPLFWVMEIKTKINKWYLTKQKFLHSEVNYKQTEKNNPQNGREYLQIKWLTRDSFPKYTISISSSMWKTKINKWTKWLNRKSSKEDTLMAKRHVRRTSIIISEMQIKCTMMYHFILVRMAIIKKSINNKC